MRESVAPFMSFFNGPFGQLNKQPDVANFAVGNPQEMPLQAYVAALRDAAEPQDKDWFAYKLSEGASQRTVAATLTARTGMDWDPDDVALTNGGFAAIAVALRTLVEPGDEVVFLSPPWFFYEMLILAAGGEPVRVPLEPPAFDLDLERMAQAIGPRTRAIMLNSPHNPSGRVYPAADLRALAGVLTDASARAAPRPAGAGTPRDGIRGQHAGGHLLHDGPLADRRRPGFHRPARASSSAGPAGHHRRGAGLVPDQPDRVGPDGRGGDPAVRGSSGRGARLTLSIAEVSPSR